MPTKHIANGGQSAKLLVVSIFVLLMPDESNVGVKPPQAICWAVGEYCKMTKFKIPKAFMGWKIPKTFEGVDIEGAYERALKEIDRHEKANREKMNQVCQSLNDCSIEIKNWLTKQPEVKEESLTDWFLYNLSERIPAMKYIQFSRIEEGQKTGADWEWWFVFSDKRSFGTRVQAKKLKSNKDNYPGIAYTSNGRLQIERLLEDSADKGLASFYAFYSAEDKLRTLCGGKLNGEGVFFGEANKLQQELIMKNRRTLVPVDILRFTNPVSCLFCCPMTYEGRDIEEGFKRHLSEYYPTFSDNENISKNIDKTELGFQTTPNHIRQMIDSEEIPEWWQLEYRHYLEGINALVVIDLRDKEINIRQHRL